jgi:hypothetical protein
VGLTAGDGTRPDAVGDAGGTTIARGRGEAADGMAEVPAVPAGPPGTEPAVLLESPAMPWPGTSNAIVTAATMIARAAAQTARAVPKPLSAGRKLMTSRRAVRAAGRA